MLHLHFEKHPDLRVLAEIRELHRKKGGKVILYQRITSAVVMSWGSTHLEWVPPHSTRTWVGLRYAFWTAMLGWWSISGLWCAPAAILTDLFGGIDVTEVLTEPHPLKGRAWPPAIVKAEAVLRNREYYMLILGLILLFGGIMVYIAYAPIPFGRPNP